VDRLLIYASRVLAELPERVVEHQRGALIGALAEAQPLIIEITPPVGVRIRAGAQLLLELPAENTRQARDQATGRWAR
jgi:hypothetical protein